MFVFANIKQNQIYAGTFVTWFSSNKNKITYLIQSYAFIYKILDEGKSVDVVTIDYTKAFDKLLHKKLFSKLLPFDIDPHIYNIIYFSNRIQLVNINKLQCISRLETRHKWCPLRVCIGPTSFSNLLWWSFYLKDWVAIYGFCREPQTNWRTW